MKRLLLILVLLSVVGLLGFILGVPALVKQPSSASPTPASSIEEDAIAPQAQASAAADILEQEIETANNFLAGKTAQSLLIAISSEGRDFLLKNYSRSSKAPALAEAKNRQSLALALRQAAVASDDLYLAAGINNKERISESVDALDRALEDLRPFLKSSDD